MLGVTTADRARELLARFLGPEARFRDGQLEAIEALVDDRRRVLVVQRTGWGKSIVYLIATRLLREDGAGPTLLVSPLLALMRNQTEMGERIGVRSATINSENTDDWHGIEAAARAGEVDLLLISPERLNNPRFRDNVLAEVAHTAGLFVVDEVHCISDWGHDFRPDYRRVGRVIDLLPADRPRARAARPRPTTGSSPTSSTSWATTCSSSAAPWAGTAWPCGCSTCRPRPSAWPGWPGRSPAWTGTGIVYCLTVADANRVTQWLRREGIDAVSYTGATDPEDRIEIEAALSENRVKVVVATSALGMGYDKPDLAFVVHFQSPGLADRLLPADRAGRPGPGHRRGRAAAGPRGPRHPGLVHRDRLPRPGRGRGGDRASSRSRTSRWGSAPSSPIVNLRRSRLDGMLKVLEVEGAVARQGGKWSRTGLPWAYDAERVERVTAERRREQAAMDEFGTTDGCLMQLLLAELDDPASGPCGRCGNCAPVVEEPVDPAEVARAIEFVRGQPLIVEPRRQWPSGMDEVRGTHPRRAAGGGGPGPLSVERRRLGHPGPGRTEGRRLRRRAGRCRGPAGRRVGARPGTGVGHRRARPPAAPRSRRSPSRWPTLSASPSRRSWSPPGRRPRRRAGRTAPNRSSTSWGPSRWTVRSRPARSCWWTTRRRPAGRSR